MYGINDLQKGVLIEVDGVPYRITENQHVSMGRGGAVMRTKIKNLITGAVIERTWRAAEKVAPAQLERPKMQFLYREGNDFHFMDTASYEQVQVSMDTLGDQANYLAEGVEVQLFKFQDKIIGIDMPNSVFLKITHTEPGVKGDSATGSLKDATLETGVNVLVPLFIKEGDEVKVDTRSGAYLERKK
jgi:elongation factor P